MTSSRLRFLLMALLACLSAIPTHANHAAFQIQRIKGLAIILSNSAEGVYADEPTLLRLQLYRLPIKATTPGSPATTPVLVSSKALRCSITMPSMQGMPAITPRVVPQGTPGLYRIQANFPHGGLYSVGFELMLPGDTKPTRLQYPLAVQDYEKTVDPKLQPFMLVLKTTPTQATAGKPVELALQVLSRETKKPVVAFEVVHEKKMHLIVVHKDLRSFFHVHPELKADGTFTLPFTFPRGGEWQLFAEVAPPNVGVRPLAASIRVAGSAQSPLLASRVTKSLSFVSCVTDSVLPAKATTAGLTLTLKSAMPSAHSTVPLEFVLSDSQGKPVTNIPLWLGAPAHLVAIHKDVQTFVHSHPSDRTPAEVAAGKLMFIARFPKPGVYWCWVQIRQGEGILTFPLSVQVTKRPTR